MIIQSKKQNLSEPLLVAPSGEFFARRSPRDQRIKHRVNHKQYDMNQITKERGTNDLTRFVNLPTSSGQKGEDSYSNN